MLTINTTTANFPGTQYGLAVAMALKMQSSWAEVIFEHMQLCPQQLDQLTLQLAEKIALKYPSIQFRCHANVRLFETLHIFDASSDQTLEINKEYIKLLISVNKKLNSLVYSLHAGRKLITKDKMKDNILKLQDKLKMDVAVEGLYPSKKEEWQIASWKDYEWLLKSDLKMAIDLSHLQIVAHHEKYWDDDLVKALLGSMNCLEIHVAGNDEVHDNHCPVKGDEIWIEKLKAIKSNAVIFTEENQKVMKHKKLNGE